MVLLQLLWVHRFELLVLPTQRFLLEVRFDLIQRDVLPAANHLERREGETVLEVAGDLGEERKRCKVSYRIVCVSHPVMFATGPAATSRGHHANPEPTDLHPHQSRVQMIDVQRVPRSS